MKHKIQAVKGMNDLLPDRSAHWQAVEQTVRQLANQYSYREIRTPILEKTELFVHSIGEGTDIVEKEMFAFTDAGGEHVCMRPEGTASVVRSGIQHGLLYNQQNRLWYLGPMFRRERPQKGRYRQFNQFGMEALGFDSPMLDAEVILFGARLWKELNIRDVTLKINTLGSPETMLAYKAALVAYLTPLTEQLDEDSQRRLQTNPLRILDSKNQQTQALLNDAPKIDAYLDNASRQHFERVCAALEQASVPFKIDSSLVRGLDYYTSTVFEWQTGMLGSQNTICAGGRYDKLVAERGGQSTPAVGFALGLERLIELQIAEGLEPVAHHCDVFLAPLGAEAELKLSAIAEQCRTNGMTVQLNCTGGKLKSQLKKADQSRAKIALVLGDDELANEQVQIKYMRTEQQDSLCSYDDLIVTIQQHLSETHDG